MSLIRAAHLSLDEEKLRAVASGEVRVLYASAKEALDDLFINLLNQEDSPFRIVPVVDFRAKERLLAVYMRVRA